MSWQQWYRPSNFESVQAESRQQKGRNARRRKLDAAYMAACGTLEEVTGATVTSTDRTIRANPYGAMGTAFAVGMLLGVFENRK